MRLDSVTANRHIFAGQPNGKPLRLVLTFDNDRKLRLQVAGDGERMIADDGSLDAAFDTGELGQTDIADVTSSLFPTLRGLKVTRAEELSLNGRCVGVRLDVDGGDPFHFWADGDELHWGDEAALVGHDWLNGIAPKVAARIEV